MKLLGAAIPVVFPPPGSHNYHNTVFLVFVGLIETYHVYSYFVLDLLIY